MGTNGAPAQPSGDTNGGTSLTAAPRTSRLALASLLCGLAVPVLGFLALVDVGSDFSDLLTLTIPLFFVISVVLSVLAHWAILKAPERLIGTGVAKAGPILVALTIVGGCLLIPAT